MGFFRRSLVVVGTLLVIFGVLIVFDNVSQYTTYDDNVVAVDTTLAATPCVVEPTIMFGMVIDGFDVKNSEVKRNQRFSDLLEGYYVDGKALRLLTMIPRNVFDFRKVATNKKYTVIASSDSARSARALVYEANPIDYTVFHFTDTLVVENCQRETSTVERSIAAEIKSNLSETIESMSISHELTNGFVDIFAWQVDFQRLQKGDKFKLIYTERQVEGVPVSIESIDGIYFEHFGSPYYALPFDQCEGTDYFDENGNSLRKALLKYPIEFTRISSRFNPHRFHPVAKVFRAHKGTDFAAPSGTPIRSAGDGIVLEAQYKGGNGNYVKIKHNGTYTTQYLHMSRIGNGIRAGARVRQGQTIGYVGSTGLANGPHLCYRFWKNGVQVDALKVQLPAAEPVKPSERPAFDEVRERLIKRLEAIPFPTEPAKLAVAAN